MPENYVHETRKLEVLQCEFNAIASWMLWGVEVVLVATSIFSLCGAIWIEGIRALHIFIVAMAAMAILLTLWNSLAQIYDTAVNVVKQFKQRAVNFGRTVPWLPKYLRSTRPIRVKIGNFFYIDRMLILTLLGIITENTCGLLLTK